MWKLSEQCLVDITLLVFFQIDLQVITDFPENDQSSTRNTTAKRCRHDRHAWTCSCDVSPAVRHARSLPIERACRRVSVSVGECRRCRADCDTGHDTRVGER